MDLLTLGLGDDVRIILEVVSVIVSALLGAFGGQRVERHRARKSSTTISRKVER